MGAWAADLLAEKGGKVIAVSDVSSAIINEKGLDIKALRAHLGAGKALGEFPEGTAIPKDDVLTVPCDVLIPAAIGALYAANAMRKRVTDLLSCVLISWCNKQIMRHACSCL